MKHLRSDYDVVQDMAQVVSQRGESVLNDMYGVKPTSIGEDEPVFLIRGKDAAAPDAIRAYADVLLNLPWPSGDENKERRADLHLLVAAITRWAAHVEAWQTHHPELVKMPDVPPGSLRL